MGDAPNHCGCNCLWDDGPESSNKAGKASQGKEDSKQHPFVALTRINTEYNALPRTLTGAQDSEPPFIPFLCYPKHNHLYILSQILSIPFGVRNSKEQTLGME